MNADTAQQLLALNQTFYRDFAGAFSQTRRRIQPGIPQVLADLAPAARLLDLGCGNGELWRWLSGRGHAGEYIGLDFSPGLLQDAKEGSPAPGQAFFFERDLSAPGWETGLAAPFDAALAFAVLHHLPGADRRLALIQTIHSLLRPGGLFIHSNWQFLNSPRWQARVQPWETIGLDPAALEPGDCLLDWRSGGTGLRYVHHFSLDELAGLAAAAGFLVLQSFLSDGKEGSLGLYQVWQKV